MDSWLLAVLFTVFVAHQHHLGCSGESSGSTELLLLTVATEDTDGFKRYMRSAHINGLKGKVVGMGEEWLGGDMTGPGGGFKINLLKREMEKHKDRDDLVVMFTDSYDVLLLADKEEILKKFRSFDARVVFGAEGFCWPDRSLSESYPVVGADEKRFLNSGGFVGYAKDVYGIVTSREVRNEADDQLYYTEVFLDEKLREKFNIKLDVRSEIFHNLNGAEKELDVELEEDDVWPFILNSALEVRPSVLHGNGPSKDFLNLFGNYVPKAWKANDQCTACREDMVSLEDGEWPQVVMAVFIGRPTPFLEEFFDNLLNLNYPKDKIDLFVHNAEPYHSDGVTKFIEAAKYHSVDVIEPDDEMEEALAREAGMQHCADLRCDYYFNVDANAHLENPDALKLLIEQNRDIVAPILTRPYSAWSNFWGALNKEGFYARSSDYMKIVEGERHGLWNVPYVSIAYLMKGLVINGGHRPRFVNWDLDPDMALCKSLRDSGRFMYASNRVDFGHLVQDEGFATGRLYDEFWEIERNRFDWERRYIHPDYWSTLNKNASEVEQPCPDVYWFPIVTDRYADELVSLVEDYGKWSDGSNQDLRIDGGYENVPTRDIHMNQISFEEEWLLFLDLYVRPLQEHVFIGYYHSPAKANMNFVVRYKPDEQPYLRPHHDSSTFTINVALNQVGVDYEGGGCHFLRYGCRVTATRKGWMMMHPGRLTHYHEGLQTTNGTRYIMISFVNP